MDRRVYMYIFYMYIYIHTLLLRYFITRIEDRREEASHVTVCNPYLVFLLYQCKIKVYTIATFVRTREFN